VKRPIIVSEMTKSLRGTTENQVPSVVVQANHRQHMPAMFSCFIFICMF